MEPRWNKFCVKALKPYIKKAVFVSWMMCVQTPPMALVEAPRHGDAFDSSFYQEYTDKGPYIDYIAWPVVLLHEHGPMISKGIAQGTET